jgi:hypothetical protein
LVTWFDKCSNIFTFEENLYQLKQAKMEALYKIKANELDYMLIESIRKLFHDRDIIIKVTTNLDETDFLTFYPANEKHLLDNLAAEPEVKFSDDEFMEYVNKHNQS